MVEPIDAQNMLSRTPLVEKTAATLRENALQMNQPASQIEKEKSHQNENVQFKRETSRAEEKKNRKQKTSSDSQEENSPKKTAAGEAGTPSVELVQEAAEMPDHKLDVTI